MKPLLLTIEGINSFVQKREVDFERLAENRIFCICGPTGSGKTTILDSIILALYAPPSHHRGTLKDYINSKCDKGKITLEFEADGKRYRVNREFRRNSASAGSLECMDTGEILADGAEATTARIKQMLVLSKDDFTKVVVLEQGRFAEFMQMTKSERCRTVAKLFGLERFEKLKETIAKAKTKYEKELSSCDYALKQYEGVTEEAQRAVKHEKSVLEKERKKALSAQGEVEKELGAAEILRANHERRSSAEATLAKAESELAQIADARAKLKDEEEKLASLKAEVQRLSTESEAARVTLAQADECIKDAQRKRELTDRRQALRKDYSESDQKIKSLTAQISAKSDEILRAETILADGVRAIESAGYDAGNRTEADFATLSVRADADVRTVADTKAKRAKAEQAANVCIDKAANFMRIENELSELAKAGESALDGVRGEYERAVLEHDSAAVRARLKQGDVCPVCGGVYHGGGEGEASDEMLAALARKVDEATAKLDEIKEKQRLNRENQNMAAADLGRAKQDMADCDEALVGKDGERAKTARDAAIKCAEAARLKARAESELAGANAALDPERGKLDRIRKEGEGLSVDIAAIDEAVTRRLGGKDADVARAEAQNTITLYERKKAEADREAENFAKAAAELDTRAATARARGEEAQKTLATMPEEKFDESAYLAQKERAQKLKDELSEIANKLGNAESRIEALAERLAKKKALAEQHRALTRTYEDLLKFGKFVAGDNKLFSFVAEQYVLAFTDAASETLSRLTCGKYTLSYENGDFYVSDFFADNARRKVKTLSGGETFLASMSIAIAISRRMATQNYEFFFLDEGFGTLHERAMETVSAALRELSRETVVGIVTHRSELADTIASRLNVIPATEDEGSKPEYV